MLDGTQGVATRTFTRLVALALALGLVGCSSAYYGAWEKLGKHKRDLLRSNILEARDEQQEASEQFQDALTRIKELYGFEGGDLEDTYDTLKKEYDRSQDKADDVSGRIQKVEKIARDLFEEWEGEIEELSSEKLQRKSRAKLEDTRKRYGRLEAAMKRAEASMEPVLTQFKDQVLYLKHNLNAQAIGSLEGEVADIEQDVVELLAAMNDSIRQAEAFIDTLPEG